MARRDISRELEDHLREGIPQISHTYAWARRHVIAARARLDAEPVSARRWA